MQTDLDRGSVMLLRYPPPPLAAFSKIQSEPLLLKFKPSLLYRARGGLIIPSLFCSSVLKIALICFSSSLFLRPNDPRPFTFSIRLLIRAQLAACNNLQAVF